MERGGNVRSFPLERATLNNIKPILKQHIDPDSHLVTDEAAVYFFTKPDFANHSQVVHKAKEYVRKEADFTVTTNTVESFFALLKRSKLRSSPSHWVRIALSATSFTTVAS